MEGGVWSSGAVGVGPSVRPKGISIWIQFTGTEEGQHFLYSIIEAPHPVRWQNTDFIGIYTGEDIGGEVPVGAIGPWENGSVNTCIPIHSDIRLIVSPGNLRPVIPFCRWGAVRPRQYADENDVEYEYETCEYASDGKKSRARA